MRTIVLFMLWNFAMTKTMLCNGIAAMRCDTTIQQANDKFVVKFFFFFRPLLSLSHSLSAPFSVANCIDAIFWSDMELEWLHNN